MRLLGVIFFLVCLTGVAFAQAIKATIVGETPFVYAAPDFDSKVLAELQPGTVYDISKNKKSGFHKIRVRPGLVGWIADSELRIGTHKIKSEEDAVSDVEEKRMEKARKNTNLPMDFVRFRGVVLESVLYTEKTAGRERSAAVPFVGIKFAGPNTLFSGMMPADTSLMLSTTTPSYYKDVTQNSAKGFILIGQFQFLTNFSRGANYLGFYGFGPVARYSHFDLALGSGASKKTYAADDLALGVCFNVGAIYRWSSVGIRPEIKYYWEKNKYLSIGLSAQMAF